MVSLLDVHNTLALHGKMEITQLSQLLDTSPDLLQAMLDQLVAMRKIEIVAWVAAGSSCDSGRCKGCSQSKQALVVYRLIS